MHLLQDKVRQMESNDDITKTSQPWNLPSVGLPLQQRAQSTSCLDLNTPTDIDKLRSLLPSYRPAPDYETAVQQKYRNSSGPIPTREPLRNAHPVAYSSQPEIHQNEAYSQHMRYPDVTHNNIEQKNLMTNLYNPGYTQSQVLTNDNHTNANDLSDNLAMLHLYKPPPPYPSNRISSNSTPDLAGISQYSKTHSPFINNLVSGSSPDLVSGGNILNQHYIKHYGQTLYSNQQVHPIHRSHSYLPQQHSTYENLNTIFDNNILGRPQAVIVENPNITKHIKKVYDEHGNIIYCMPANMKQILQENQLPSTGFVVTRNQNAVVAHDAHLNNSSEPIYENIPLPWQNNNNQMRARTQSIHSAPEVSQAVNHGIISALKTTGLHNVSNQGSRENLYANIDANIDNKFSSAELIMQNSSTNNLSDTKSILNRSQQNLSTIDSPNLHKPDGNSSPQTISRTSTFIVNKNFGSNSTTFGNSSLMESTNTTAETFSDETSISNSSSNKGKKKRWGILIGRNKSSEKVKSATLGREKDKNKDKSQGSNKHRWSTGLPKLHPLPPSISKETMVRLIF